MASLTQRTWVWTNWEILKGSEAWRSSVHGVSKNRTKLSDWTNNNIQTIYKQTTIQTIYTCINILTVCIPYSRTWLTVSIVSNFIWLCFIQCCLLYLAPGAHFFNVSKCVSVSGILFLHAYDLLAIKDTAFAERNENEHWFSTGL